MHAYDPGVNGVPAFRAWGRHLDSEEAFVLLKGKGWLVTSETGEDYAIHPLCEGEMLLVEVKERHIILLETGSRTLIVENKDMSNSVTEPLNEELRSEILATIEIKEE